MAQPAANNAVVDGAADGGRQEQGFSWRGMLFQLAMFYFAYQMLFKGKATVPSTTTTQSTTATTSDPSLPPHSNFFPHGQKMVCTTGDK
jgi:hypothetical protein